MKCEEDEMQSYKNHILRPIDANDVHHQSLMKSEKILWFHENGLHRP